jgi:hypothetical protein
VEIVDQEEITEINLMINEELKEIEKEESE